MSERVSKAMQRVRAALARRTATGIHADDPAIARWQEGVRVVTCHASGTQIATDMPAELGGAGEDMTPGWLLRASLASCLATRIAMEAAASGIALTRLEVVAKSTSDVRGLLDMPGTDGGEVTAAPQNVQLEVTVAAPGASSERVRAMIDTSVRCSPVSSALEQGAPVGVRIEIETG